MFRERSDNTIMQGGNEVQLYADFWFERSTGILLENEIGMFVWNPEKSAWVDNSINLELLDFSSGGIKVQEKTDLDLKDIEFYTRFSYWKHALIMEGVFFRYSSGAYGNVDKETIDLFGESALSFASYSNKQSLLEELL